MRGTPTARFFKRVALHAALMAGAVLFSLPFLWLISTASKEDREIFQSELAWLPDLPRRIQVSPYWDDAEYPPLPADLSDTARALLRADMLRKAEALPALARRNVDSSECLEGVYHILQQRVPDALWDDPEQLAAFVRRHLSSEDVLAVYEKTRKRFALGGIRLYGWALEREFPHLGRPASEFWTVETPAAARLVDTTRAGDPIAEVHYNLTDQREIRLSAVVPYEMPREQFKRISLSLVADRTWRDCRVALELDGQRYEGAGRMRLGYDQWHEWALQPASEEDKRMKVKTWMRLDPVGASSAFFNEPGRMKVFVTVDRTPWLKSVWNKLTHNYSMVFAFVPFWRYTYNSVLLVLLNIVGTLVSCSLVAYAFARLRWPGREFCFVLLLSTLMIPPQVTMIPVFLVFSHLGWYNTFQPLWVPSLFASAFGVFLLRQFMRSIPRDLEESARIDGCSFFGAFYHIILPLIRPALAAIAIFAFMGVWNDFMGPLIYLNDQRLFPLSLGLFALRVFVGQNFGLLLAASILMTVPVIVVFFLAQRHFIQGITLTGMKE